MMSHQFSAYGAPLLGTSELNGQQILPSGESSMETGTSPSANGEEKDINLESKSNETAEQDTDMPLEGASNGGDIIMEVVDDGKVDMVPENNSNEQSLEERTA